MSIPALPTRVEEDDDPFSDGISATQVAGFRKIALMTGPGEISRGVSAPVLRGDNMLDMKGEQKEVGFMKLTVLTALPGTKPDVRTSGGIHAGRPRRASMSWAFARRIAMTSPATT
jgi:hypothetical protein